MLVCFFQIARKDINNIILPPKWGKRLLEKGWTGWDWNSWILPHSPPVKGSNQPAITCWDASNFSVEGFILFKNRNLEQQCLFVCRFVFLNCCSHLTRGNGAWEIKDQENPDSPKAFLLKSMNASILHLPIPFSLVANTGQNRWWKEHCPS